MNQAKGMITNQLLTRKALIDQLVDTDRDINFECGYPDVIGIDHYHMMYKRELGSRVVGVWPEESWVLDPQILEDERPDLTPWEEEFDELQRKHNFWYFLSKIDELSGIGRYGVLLFGVDDEGDLADPLDSVVKAEEDGEIDIPAEATGERDLLYLRAFDEKFVTIAEYEKDPSSRRFGQPTFYNFKFHDVDESGGRGDSLTTEQKVHWSRCLHVAETGKTPSEVFGTPRQEPVFNRLWDSRKLVGGSAEMFWKGAFPGLSFELQPDVAADAEIDIDTLKTEVDAYFNSMQRYLALEGMTTKSLAPQVASPSDHFDILITCISIIIKVPKRIFMGSEEARLASDQDTRSFNKRVMRRQQQYLTPRLVRAFVNRLMVMGILSPVDNYDVVWPDLDALTEMEIAELGSKRTEALAKYVGGNVEALVPPKEFLTMILGFSVAEAEAIIEAAVNSLADEDHEDHEDLTSGGSDELEEDNPGDGEDDEDETGSVGKRPRPKRKKQEESDG